jgi:hypothetical protein
MKPFLLSILFVFLVFPVTIFAQTLDLKVKGIGVGTSYSTVLKKLGKPLSSKKHGSFPCDNGNSMLTLRYSGLVIKLIQDNNNQYFVASMEVTSPKWAASGIKIGASIREVQKRFGQNNNLSKERGLENLQYFNGDGYADFYFRNNKLTKVVWELNAC